MMDIRIIKDRNNFILASVGVVPNVLLIVIKQSRTTRDQSPYEPI